MAPASISATSYLRHRHMFILAHPSSHTSSSGTNMAAFFLWLTRTPSSSGYVIDLLEHVHTCTTSFLLVILSRTEHQPHPLLLTIFLRHKLRHCPSRTCSYLHYFLWHRLRHCTHLLLYLQLKLKLSEECAEALKHVGVLMKYFNICLFVCSLVVLNNKQ